MLMKNVLLEQVDEHCEEETSSILFYNSRHQMVTFYLITRNAGMIWDSNKGKKVNKMYYMYWKSIYQKVIVHECKILALCSSTLL